MHATCRHYICLGAWVVDTLNTFETLLSSGSHALRLGPMWLNNAAPEQHGTAKPSTSASHLSYSRMQAANTNTAADVFTHCLLHVNTISSLSFTCCVGARRGWLTLGYHQ